MRKLLVGVVLLSGIALGFFLIQGKLPLGLTLPPSLQKLTGNPPPTAAQSATVYQYRNEQGFIELSNEPPPVGVEYTTVVAKGIQNRVDQNEPVPAASASWLDRIRALLPGGEKKKPEGTIRDAASAAEPTSAPGGGSAYSGYVNSARNAADQANTQQQESQKIPQQ